MSAWTVTSRAVVGSSAMITFGSQLIAIAMTTRWRWPPESSCGYLAICRSGSGMPTMPSSSTALSTAAWPRATPCSSIDSTIWVPIVSTGLRAVMGSWKTIATSLPRRRRMVRSDRRPTSLPATLTTPPMRALRGSNRMAVIEVTDLPEPDSPTSATTSPGRTRRSTPLTACTLPNSVLKRTSTSSKESTTSSPSSGVPEPVKNWSWSFWKVVISRRSCSGGGRRRHGGRRPGSSRPARWPG